MATPREVRIDLSCPFPYRAGAEFFSTIAYPHPSDGALRDRFCRSLCRWQVLKRALEDSNYATTAQLIPPVIFSDEYADFWKAFQQGIIKLKQRTVATFCIAMPCVAELTISGQKAGVKNLGKIGAQSLGWSSTSGSNFISDVWTDTKSVAHAMMACLIMHSVSIPERLIKSMEQIPDTFNRESLEQKLQDTFSWDFEKHLRNPLSLGPIIDVAEQLRSKLPEVRISGKAIFRKIQ